MEPGRYEYCALDGKLYRVIIGDEGFTANVIEGDNYLSQSPFDTDHDYGDETT